MKKIAISVLISSALISCGGNVNSNDVSETTTSSAGTVSWLTKNSRGFEALVDSSYTTADMQNTFGDYCKTNRKDMRSLRMVPEGNGQNRVIGDCF